MASSFGWQAVFWVFSLLRIPMAVLFWLGSRDAPGGHPQEASLAARLAVFRHSPLSWVLGLFYLVTFGGFLGLSVHLSPLLV